jgi:cellulose synthase/poly-beta-1,6-N-acetylglucosamine synthase-like glycosyltransferase
MTEPRTAPGPASAQQEHAIRYSVIVPAYNAQQTLEACLKALADQSVPAETFEVIVVDDGSTDATAEVAERYPVRVLRQAHAGPATARNLGARVARGRYLLFTDADCIPTRDWIEQITRPLEADERVAGVKGTYRTGQTSLVARFAQVEFEEKYAHLRQAESIDFIDTGSAAFRRDAFWEIGGFDARFRAASNEDTQLSFSLVARGWRLAFADRATVYHKHSESLTRYVLRKWRHGFWRVQVYQRHPAKMTGDSYTPRSTQLQFAGVVLAMALAPLRPSRRFAPLGLLLFLIGTVPFVRRAWSVGWDVAAATPFILLARALALASGLALGTLAAPFLHRPGDDQPDADDPGTREG